MDPMILTGQAACYKTILYLYIIKYTNMQNVGRLLEDGAVADV